MRNLVINSLVLLVLVIIVIPAILVRGCSGDQKPSSATPVTSGLSIKVHFTDDNRVETMPLEEYIKGVIAAELSPKFEAEALKAQAVVARTYAVRRMRIFGGRGCPHDPKADICADPRFGQAYISREGLRQKFGILGSYRYWRQIERAEAETRGLLITYQGEPIDAVYHSTSVGSTEDAKDVWGLDLPYLKPVPDQFGTESPFRAESKTLTFKEVASALGLESIAVSGGKKPVEIVERTSAGRAKSIRVGQKVIAARDFRERLGLRSTDLTVTVSGKQIIITTKGYGHGVGLSQYGANGLAKLGKTYEDILKHYYTGVSIERIYEE
jgi:stage II sporulation protein D